METLHLVRNAYDDDNFNRYAPEKKDHASTQTRSKGVHKQKLCNL